MELKDTINLMTSSDYKERAVGEYLQLDIRIKSLSNMLEKYAKGALNFNPSCSLELLQMQLNSMITYREILKTRLNIENCFHHDELHTS